MIFAGANMHYPYFLMQIITFCIVYSYNTNIHKHRDQIVRRLTNHCDMCIANGFTHTEIGRQRDRDKVDNIPFSNTVFVLARNNNCALVFVEQMCAYLLAICCNSETRMCFFFSPVFVCVCVVCSFPYCKLIDQTKHTHTPSGNCCTPGNCTATKCIIICG